MRRIDEDRADRVNAVSATRSARREKVVESVQVASATYAPTLAVLPLSESISLLWPTLALDEGLQLTMVADVAALARDDQTIRIISAAGAEERAEELLQQLPPERVAVVGTVADHRLAISLVRSGAADYFVVPHEIAALRAWVREQADTLRVSRSRSEFASREGRKYRFDGILGDSAALRHAIDRASRVIPAATATVLLLGETGTGKELFARAIHYNGPRREAPFVDVNCAAIPEHLLESEMFGHERGAFTDATSAKAGLFEVASGGTLFLDEIGHFPLGLQGKLLRALEERAIRRVGATRSISIDVRVIAATHVDLAAAVRDQRFREDLYYRLNVVPIRLPALRERRADIVPLALHFLRRFAAEYDREVRRLTPSAEEHLVAASWPGNVRELRNVIERAVILTETPAIDALDLAVDDAPTPTSDSPLPFPATLGQVTQAAVHAMVGLCRKNKSEAARRLGISRTRLLRILHADDPSHIDLGD
jgi:DNA-binding NtrC family response regulator